MKKTLLASLLAVSTIVSFAQSYTSMNRRAEEYLRSTVDSLVIENPQSVIIKRGTNDFTVNVTGHHNGYDYDISFKTEITPVHYVNESSTGIKVESDKDYSFANPARLTLCKNTNTSKITIEGKDYTYSLQQEGGTNNTRSITKETNSQWDFNIPFSGGKKNESRYYSNARFSLDLLSDLEFGLGLVSATKQAPGMNVEWGNAGWEFILNNIFKWEYRPLKGTSLSLGFGVDWRNYRMTGNQRFLKQDNILTIAPYPDGADINFSRVKVFSMTLELLLRQKITKKVSVAAGPVINFNSHASIKTRYAIGKGKEKEGFKETSSSIHQKPVTFDYKGVISIDPLSFYFKYSPVNTLETSFGPAFRSMSAGVLIEL